MEMMLLELIPITEDFLSRNRRTGYVFTINYDASPSFQEAIIPNITRYSNGTVDLIWENYGKVFIYEGENDTYWETVQWIASMNGTSYTAFMMWLSTANDSYPYYNLWSVWTGWPGKPLLTNYECFAFVWTSLGKLRELGAKYVPNAKAKQSFICVYSSNVPQKVDMSLPSERNKVVTFYETLEGALKDLGIIKFLESLYDILIDGEFYIRKDDDYYHVNMDQFPYFDIHYVNMPLP